MLIIIGFEPFNDIVQYPRLRWKCFSPWRVPGHLPIWFIAFMISLLHTVFSQEDPDLFRHIVYDLLIE